MGKRTFLLAGGLLCGAALIILFYLKLASLGTDLKALKAADEKAQAAIAEKEKANLALTAENAALREKDAAGEVEKSHLRADLARRTAENDKLREDLKTAPPETVLAQTRGWLNTTEIWLRSNAAAQVEAAFSLVAFRLNADALAERQFIKFTLVPSLEAQLKTSEDQNGLKMGIIGNQQIIIANKDGIIRLKDTQIGVRDDAIKALKKFNLGREARDFGLGVLFATALNLIFGK